jgi:hypothetical protein
VSTCKEFRLLNCAIEALLEISSPHIGTGPAHLLLGSETFGNLRSRAMTSVHSQLTNEEIGALAEIAAIGSAS